MKKIKVLIDGKQPLTLKQADYLAQGGEGAIYVKGGMAYKVYHDPGHMVAEQKIGELRVIDGPHVVAPMEILYHEKSGEAVGFSMKYIKDVEYLCRLFVGNFKKTNNISPTDIVELVKTMQRVLNEIHQKNIIVADYNEMNILVDASFTHPYHIDVDSYQTPAFPATAIMESVRDRLLPFGEFNQMSDWFSWGIVTFQLYAGVHPYKGRHPGYKPGDLDRRMKNNVSVFDSQVRLPASCRDFSVIPPAHLEWYKRVFNNGERLLPPFLDKLQLPGWAPIVLPAAVASKGVFRIHLVEEYPQPVRWVEVLQGSRYVVAGDALYKDGKKQFSLETARGTVLLAATAGDEPVTALRKEDNLRFFDARGNLISTIAADDFMSCNRNIYTLNNGYLWENSFQKIGKIKHLVKPIASVPVLSSKLYPGMAVIDLFGKKALVIPHAPGKSTQVTVPELQDCRVIEAARMGRFCFFIVEKNREYHRVILQFDKMYNKYKSRVEQNIQFKELNFIVKQNGLVISWKDTDTLELFNDIAAAPQEIADCPAESTMRLYDGIDKTYAADDRKLYSITNRASN